MESVQDVFKNNSIPIRASLHDCANTLGTQTLVDGVRTLYTNDAEEYEYLNGATPLWDEVASIAKDTILDSKIDIIVGGIMNAPAANTLLRVELVIDVGGTGLSEIPIDERTFDITRNNADLKEKLNFLVYNGAAAFADGFKLYLTAIGGTVDIKNKTILVRV